MSSHQIDKKTPNLGNLCLAILEHLVKPVIGETAIGIIREPYNQQENFDLICLALERAEGYFVKYYEDKEFANLLVDLSINTNPKINEAIWNFFQSPEDLLFFDAIFTQISSNNPSISSDRIQEGVDVFIRIIRSELSSVNDQVRQMLLAQDISEIRNNSTKIAKTLSNINEKLSGENSTSKSDGIVLHKERSKKLLDISNKFDLPSERMDKSKQYFYKSELQDFIAYIIRGKIEVISILMIDIDDLSIINKVYGKEVGDIVLKVVAKNIDDVENGYWGRCGDDTFFCVLPTVNIENALRLSRVLLKNIRKYNWSEIAINLHVTCCIGVAKLNIPERVDEWVVRASIGMREAKKNKGKNSVKTGPLFLSAEESRELRNYYS